MTDPTDAQDPTPPEQATGAAAQTPEGAESLDAPAVGRSGQPAWLIPGITGVAGLVLGLTIGLISALVIPTALEASREQSASDEQATAVEKARLLLQSSEAACDADVDIAADKSSMFIDGKGKDFGSGDVSIADIECLLTALNTPDAVINKMNGTRALDGRQDGSWGNYEASWTYHPDDGLDIIIEVVE